jgi:Raf kinase inhibitor-like YbhB/YbcL family protein
MKLTSSSFGDGQVIPGEFAFCVPHERDNVCLGNNRNPQLSWSELPQGTKSLVLVCHDPDVPSRGDDVNKEGRTVPASLPRVDFFHWVLVDLAPQPAEIPAGAFSGEVTPCGKPGPAGPRGTRQGVNNYTEWFAGDKGMCGSYFGYDGPCPPWNDEIPHRYIFILYALDVERCPVEGSFTGPQVLEAIRGHVLAQASLSGRYALNPSVKL